MDWCWRGGGGGELIGINSWMLWPGAIHEIRDHEYVLVHLTHTDELL